MKYLSIDLNTSNRNIYCENDKMLMKDIKEDQNKWGDIHVPELEDNKM